MTHSAYPEMAAIQKILSAHGTCCNGKATLCEEICLCDCHRSTVTGEEGAKTSDATPLTPKPSMVDSTTQAA